MEGRDGEGRFDRLRRVFDEGLRQLRDAADVLPGNHLRLVANRIESAETSGADELFLVQSGIRWSLGVVRYRLVSDTARLSQQPDDVNRCVDTLLQRLWYFAESPVACHGLQYFADYLDLSRPEITGMYVFRRSDGIMCRYALE